MAKTEPDQDPIVPAPEAPETPETAETAATAEAEGADAAHEVKSRFARAIEDARNNAAEMASAAREQAGAAAAEWTEQAGNLASQARDKGIELARQGKEKTSEAIATVGRALSDTAPVIDEKLGPKIGDYARATASALESSAEQLAAKDFNDLGEDMKTFVRNSPATALGIAAVTGFLFARLFSRSGSRDA